jgi:arsenate reductase
VEAPNDAAYDQIVSDLEDRFGSTWSRAEIQAAVDAARAEIEPQSHHPEFLTILVGKHARDHLVAAAKRTGRTMRPVPHLLFVCEHNSARSQMAAAFAEHFGGAAVHVHSAGPNPRGALRPLVREVMAAKGVELDDLYASGVTDDVVHAADVIIEIGTSLPEVPGKTHVSWDVPDLLELDEVALPRVRDDLKWRVLALLESLGVRQLDAEG